jgi:hypothetical protein
MPTPEKVPLGRRLRYGMRKYRAEIALFILAVGVLLTVLAAGYFTPLSTMGPFPAINAATDTSSWNYNLLFVIVGPIIVIVGTYMVGAYFNARHKFEHLMLTKSKAEFLRNIPELEELLWDLTPADEERYEAKRAELKVRR